MTSEERAARAAERAAAKAAKRRANKEDWKFHPANANAKWLERQVELKRQAEEEAALTLAAPVEPSAEPNGDAGGSSLAKMRALMTDVSIPLFRRIDAGEVVLGYEIAAEAGVGVDPERILSNAYQFFRAVVDAAGTPEPLRFRALRALVTIENSRKAAIQNSAQITVKRELLVRLCNAERRRSFRKAGVWSAIISQGGDAWALKPSDDFDWPNSGWPGDWSWPPAGFTVQLEQASPERTEAFRAELRAVRAKNRPDDWETLLTTD